MKSLSVTRSCGIDKKLSEHGQVFRGCSDATYRLIPTIGRLPGTSLDLEKELLDQFSAHVERSIDGDLTAWDRLIIAQHYGIPTRLLDWTSNPFVALYFAARRPKSTRFAVYVADVVVLDHVPDASPFAITEPTFIRPRLLDERICNQDSVFSIQGDPRSDLPLDVSHFTFPAGLRTDILELCEQHGITEEVLFPTGLAKGWTVRDT